MPAFFLTVLALPVAWALAAWALSRAGRTRPPEGARFDAIVVLGCRVMPDGTAGEGLERRTALGVALHRAGAAPILVLSGGAVTGPVSEARAASRVALDAGAPASAIRLEERSRTTRENALFTRATIDARRVLVVTHGYHAPRARLLFRRVFGEVETAGVSSSARSWPEVRSALREVLPFVLTALRIL